MKSNPDITYRLGIMLEATKLQLAESRRTAGTFSNLHSATDYFCREAQAIRRQMQEA